MLDVPTNSNPGLTEVSALVLLVGEGEMPFGLWQQADEATGCYRACRYRGRFRGRKGKICTPLAPGAGLSRVVAVGLGKWPNCPRMC